MAVCRALGDWKWKPPHKQHYVITNQSECSHFPLGDQSRFLILACDGLWETLSNEEAVQIANKCLGQGDSCSPQTLKAAANAIVQAALEKKSTDNITAMVIGLH